MSSTVPAELGNATRPGLPALANAGVVLALYGVMLPVGSAPAFSMQDTTSTFRELATVRTLLSDYREGEGMFSSNWASYVRSEGEDDARRWFVDLNGRSIGPFDNVSRMVAFSPDGGKAAFAARSVGREEWNVYVNGALQGSFPRLFFGTYTWPVGLHGTSIVSQSGAAVLQYSSDGEQLAYFVGDGPDESRWAVAVNGARVSSFWDGINTRISFVRGVPAFWGFRAGQRYLVVGDSDYGPYGDLAANLTVSANGNHFAFAIDREDADVLVVDGVEASIAGDIKAISIADDGQYAVVVDEQGEIRVEQDGLQWPGHYTGVLGSQFIPGSNGHLAGWFEKDDGWYVVRDGRVEYGPYDSYFYYRAGPVYSLFLGRTGENVGYFAKQGGATRFFANGMELEKRPAFSGIAPSVYVDENRNVIGQEMMVGVDLDRAAVVEAAIAGADDPTTARYVGTRLVYTTARGEQESYLRVDGNEYGPFLEIGGLQASPSGQHFAFHAKTPDGELVIVDGTHATPHFENVHRLRFVGETEVAFLTESDGQILRISARTP